MVKNTKILLIMFYKTNLNKKKFIDTIKKIKKDIPIIDKQIFKLQSKAD